MVQPQQAHRPSSRPVLEAYKNVTDATYTAKAGDRVVGVNRAGVVTVTLPSAEVRKGRIYTVKDESGSAASNNITIATEGSETIDGSATDVISLNYQAKSYYSGGTNWFILPITPDTNTQLTLSTTVSTQAHGDSAAGGSASTASKGDHKHAMPVAEGGPAQSTQAALEAETDEDTYTPPDLIKHSPGVAKAWADCTGGGSPSFNDSYNMTSISNPATGQYTLTIATDFSAGNYAALISIYNSATRTASLQSRLAGTIDAYTWSAADDTAEDANFSIAMFGDQ